MFFYLTRKGRSQRGNSKKSSRGKPSTQHGQVRMGEGDVQFGRDRFVWFRKHGKTASNPLADHFSWWGKKKGQRRMGGGGVLKEGGHFIVTSQGVELGKRKVDGSYNRERGGGKPSQITLERGRVRIIDIKKIFIGKRGAVNGKTLVRGEPLKGVRVKRGGKFSPEKGE